MTPLWTGAAAAAATNGRLRGDFGASGLSIDSRSIAPGDMFVALTDSRDGHDFVAAAFAQGAAAALVSRVPDDLPEDAPLLIVDDVLGALEDMARAARDRTAARVIAITGSAGKTSTKEMLRDVLSRQGRTHAAEASLNNHWGVPLTLARMPENTQFAVIEIGMNHPGEIAPLAKLARPHVAVVTTVAAAHLEAFDSVAAIAREKGSIFQGLEPGGTAIWNADVANANELAAAAKSAGAAKYDFGRTAKTVIVDRIDLHPNTTVLRGRNRAHVVRGGSDDGAFIVKIGAVGAHFAMNAVACLSAVECARGDWDIAAVDLGAWHPPGGRGAREVIELGADGDGLSVALIDDAFNANPASMAAGLAVLAAAQGRRVAVLGDMLELGPEAANLHRDVAKLEAAAAIDTFHCVGPLMRATYDALPPAQRGHWVETADELAAMARDLVAPGDVVLVKGSKSSFVSRVVDAIRKLGHPQRIQPSEAD